jgi:hypothetical protein
MSFLFWCGVRDSNPRTRKELIYSQPCLTASLTPHVWLLTAFAVDVWSRQRDSNPRPAVYKTAALATELCRPGVPDACHQANIKITDESVPNKSYLIN